MKYILSSNIALRSFWLVPYAYYYKGSSRASGLNEEEFELLKKCDGKTEIEENELTKLLVEKKFIVENTNNLELTSWQKYRNCDNRYMPMMNLQITGKCNYNCKHCFNAADNAPLATEFSLDEMNALLDQCVECGVSSFTITGGEPMAYRYFKELIQGIYQRNMFVFDFNTNGYFINQEILDFMKDIGCKPLMKISFDGIGFHNWMRGNDKAEEKTLEAIKLCLDNGFKVKVQMNVNKKNLSCINKSLELLDEMGVGETRIIKTTDAPRWKENADGQSLNLLEYYDASLDIVKEYISKPHKMYLTVWLVLGLSAEKKYYNLIPAASKAKNYRSSEPICKQNRGMIAVGSNGNVYPCMQMQGWYEQHNIKLGNVKQQGLKAILQDSKYMEAVCTTIQDKIDHKAKCKDCKYLKVCHGGCPAIAILTSGDYYQEDKSKCLFFENGYAEKFAEILKDYENLSVIDTND